MVSRLQSAHNGPHERTDIAGRRSRIPLKSNTAGKHVFERQVKRRRWFEPCTGSLPSGASSPAGTGDRKQAGAAAAAPVVKPSVITESLHVTGNLASGGELLVDGSVTGDIHVRGLTIGTSGKVEGKIVAEEITVSGTVDGQISAKTVTIGRTARVTGDVLHDVLSIESGAEFQGRCQRRPASELEAPKTAAQLAAQGQKAAQAPQKAAKATALANVRPVTPPKAAGASATPAS